MTINKFVIVFVLISFSFLGFFRNVNSAIDCLTINSNSSPEDKAYCQNELNKIEAELASLIKKQHEQQKNTGTLTGDVKYLNAQITALKTKVKARAMAIAQLKVSISDKVTKIEKLSDTIENQYDSLSQLLRNTNNLDNENIIHLLFSTKNLSAFYDDLQSYSSLKQAIKTSVDQIKGVKTMTEAEKKELEKKRNAETDAKIELESAEKKTSQAEAEKKKLLNISKNKEAEYKKLAAEKKAKADKIRAALFALRDTKAIPFGTALEYAKEAEKKTGVRAAFLLAIITQETNLGANVGTCNRPTDPVTKSWKVIMKPERDIEPYKRITTALGIPQEGTPLSCPWGGGWGGAMGPSQFIPSTWESYAKKVANALGISGMPNPWNPKHAFMASSIYLGELGASAGGYTAERTAALKYYAGGAWAKASNAFYGNQVMARVTKIQADIDLLSN